MRWIGKRPMVVEANSTRLLVANAQMDEQTKLMSSMKPRCTVWWRKGIEFHEFHDVNVGAQQNQQGTESRIMVRGEIKGFHELQLFYDRPEHPKLQR